jgi:hypothetical protein
MHTMLHNLSSLLFGERTEHGEPEASQEGRRHPGELTMFQTLWRSLLKHQWLQASLLIVPIFAIPVFVHAETRTQVIGGDELHVVVVAADDHIVYYLNQDMDHPVAQSYFNGPTIDKDIASLLKTGENRLTCKATDDDGGSCFSFEYRVFQKRGNSVWTIVHSSDSCCNSTQCQRTNPVLDEIVWINKQ